MPNFIDLTGQKFGRLMVEKRYGHAKDKHITWLCLCECGKQVIVMGNSLTGGKTKSCGCLQKEIMKKVLTTHGSAHRNKKTRTYNIWISMKQRCNDPYSNGYNNYGGRGITICDRWLKPNGQGYKNFLEDMGKIPKGKSLDRINNSILIDGYSPTNCKLSTMKQQNRNKRTNIFTNMNNEILCLEDALKKYDIAKTTYYRRLNKYKKSPEETIKELIMERINEN